MVFGVFYFCEEELIVGVIGEFEGWGFFDEGGGCADYLEF